MMKIDLDNQVALVTGAARGIGQAIADAFLANGATVIYADIDERAVGEATSYSEKAWPLVMDVSDETQINQGLDRIIVKHQRVDILVNNAGVNTLENRVTIDQFPLDEWDRILKIDLTGTYMVSRAVARLMISEKRGHIINIASVLGVVPARMQCAFTAAKAGVINLSRAMALELAGHGIYVNCIAPGSIVTDATRALFYNEDAQVNENAQRLLSHIPLGRPGRVQEIAHAALFFAALESSYITGQVLCVDGGWSAGGFFRDF